MESTDTVDSTGILFVLMNWPIDHTFLGPFFRLERHVDPFQASPFMICPMKLMLYVISINARAYLQVHLLKSEA